MMRSIMGLLLLPVLVVCTIQHRESLSAPQGAGGAALPQGSAGTGSAFLASLPPAFRLPELEDRVSWRLLAEYGAVLVARGGAIPPPTVVFPDAASVAGFQGTLARKQIRIGGIPVELQTPAMEALEAARKEAIKKGLRITPRSRDAARRTYERTARLWAYRVVPGLEHWVRQKRLTQKEASRLRRLPPGEQVAEILSLEDQGLYFGKGRSKSILNAVAAPGSSQHLSLLALDVTEHANPKVRAILARHGWVQTVVSDLPHFTYLGVREEELPSLGLRKVARGARTFWVPEISASNTEGGGGNY